VTEVMESGPQKAAATGQAFAVQAGVPILMYHEIAARPISAARLAVNPDSFAEQLAYLAVGGYSAMSAWQLAAAMKSSGSVPDKPVVLTFDDGFADFHDVVVPLLARYGFTASLYVTSGWVAGQPEGRGRGAPPGMLSWEQLAEIAAAGVEIGSHSVSHPQLDQLPADSLREELARSKREIEDRLGVAVGGVAYPFGYSSRLVRATAAGVGYQYGCAVGNRLASNASDQFTLPRLTIARSTRLSTFSRAVAASQLPAEFARYRMLTTGYSMVRHAKAARNRMLG
jgi:peptidoglycan/xylan/chitin deacetylase (PgdA/CDA1 family)